MVSEPNQLGTVVVSAVGSINELLRQFREDGVDPSSSMGNRAIHVWLGTFTDRFCTCGERIRHFERLNGRCERCRLQHLRRTTGERA